LSSYIRAIEYYLPKNIEENDPQDRMTKKIGINSKHIASENEFASDLAFNAGLKLFENGISPEEIDFFIYCTQSPDHFLPTTACILQTKLGLPKHCGALDINLGCSGYVYGLSLAKGIIESGQASNVLLITADTYSKFVNPNDRSVKLLFGDAATATLISKEEASEKNFINSFVFGTDGTGEKNLIVPAGGLKKSVSPNTSIERTDDYGNIRSENNLYMNGQEVFKFSMKEVPKAVEELLNREVLSLDDYDYFIFHQANEYMLESLRRKVSIPKVKFSIRFSDVGNTVSSTIPIALKREVEAGNIKSGNRVMLVGFGVGYSWGACSVVWK
jgi:3-oxoacyl-[acyl-carrier-protein] synthase III